MSNQLFSIIIPSFNRERLIEDTLNSILSQTYRNWECIIVDDGSTDKTKEIVKDYCTKDYRFIFLNRSREPKGAPTCRNIGLENSKGDYIIFLDSDDIMFPFALEQRRSFLNKHPHVHFCISEGIKGEYPILYSNEYKIISTKKDKNVLKEFYNLTPPWVCLNPTYKKLFLINFNIKWDEILSGFQDIDFHIRVIQKTSNFLYIQSTPDCLWRTHDIGNIGKSLNYLTKNFEQRFHIVKKGTFNSRKNIHEPINELMSSILSSYFDPSIPTNLANKALNFYIKKYNKRLFDKILFKTYRLCTKHQVKGSTFIFSRIINYRNPNLNVFENSKNTHFVQKQYNIEKLNL